MQQEIDVCIIFTIMMRETYSKHVVISVLRLFNICYTSDYVQKLLDENSDGNNLLGIISVLKIYGLIVEPRKITNELGYKNLDISKPFITEYENNIILVKELAGNIVVGYVNGKEISYCKDDFFMNWSGIIVSISKGESVGEPNFSKHLRSNQYKWLSRIVIMTIVLTMSIYKMAFFNMPFYIYMCFLLSILGVSISYHIELSHYSSDGLINKLCSLVKHSSCNLTRDRNSRYITALGFSYFCSMCVFILLPLNNYALTILIVTLSSIEVIWSLLSQLKKQEFCIACLLVQIIMIAMGLIGVFNFTELHLQDFMQQGVVFISIFVIVFCVSIFQLWPYIASQFTLKNKSKIADYYKRRYLDNFISFEESTIKIFLNPFCSPCKDEFMASYNLLINNYERSKVLPVIIVSDAKGEKVGMSIINGGNTISIFYRLKEWYSWGYHNPHKFECNYSITSEDKLKLENVLKENLDLAHKYNIQHTPSIIYNDKEMPSSITLVDILTQ